MSNRRKVREIVLKSLYATEFSGDSADEILSKILRPEFSAPTREMQEFAEKLYLVTLDKKSNADELITTFLKNWKLERLANIDRIILEMGVTELLYFNDIPAKVTINECIDLAKKYSTGKSGRFVNGILDSALDHLLKEGRVNKTGRGLIDQTL